MLDYGQNYFLDCEFFPNTCKGGNSFHGDKLDPLFRVVQEADYTLAHLVGLEIVERTRFKKTYNEDVEQLLSNMPVRAVVKVWSDQRDKVVLLVVPFTH